MTQKKTSIFSQIVHGSKPIKDVIKMCEENEGILFIRYKDEDYVLSKLLNTQTAN
jgi:hypothetical protein